MREQDLVWEFLYHELGPAGFQVACWNVLGTKWKVRRLYVSSDEFHSSAGWSADVYYNSGKVEVVADWVPYSIIYLANPDFGALLRSTLSKSWERHMEEVVDGIRS